MMKNSKDPDGKKRIHTRQMSEKGEAMKTNKTLKAVAMICAGVILLQGYAAAADNDEVAGTEPAAYTANAQTNEAENGNLGVVILANVVTPWGTVPGLMTIASGIGMIVDALTLEKNEKPELHQAAEQLARTPENKTDADLSANDKN